MSPIDTLKEELHDKIKVLNETTWESRIKRPIIDKWLANFDNVDEKYHALFLLSNFMYFGDIQIKQLLVSLYRDLYKYPIIESVRKNNGNTVNFSIIDAQYKDALKHTRFMAMGNASESGAHLLYLFRQVNKLQIGLFDDPFIVDSDGRKQLKDTTIRHYVLFDDFCGSGSQAIDYSKNTVADIKAIDPAIKVSYLMLFATKTGKFNVSVATLFDRVDAVVEFDESFKFFNSNSRYLQKCPDVIDKVFLKDLCKKYGEPLIRDIGIRLGWAGDGLDTFVNDHVFGFGNCQLLIGFSHNTPDNTLPIIWYDEQSITWYPIFKRYNKVYGT
jgi:hypothetical protein